MEKIDLHIHTNFSDGNLSIQEIIDIAKQNDCHKISITDHEVINDYSSLTIKNDIEIINGIEFNTSEKGMHILGYGIIDIERVRKKMYNLHKENENVSYQLIEKLAKLGIDISSKKVFEYLLSNNIKCDFLDKRHIVKYLIDYGYTKDVFDTYSNLIGRGTDLYIPLKKIMPVDIIELINKCGGVAVLAHPYTLSLSEKQLLLKIKELVEYGLEGIEIINGKLPKENILQYKTIANQLKLLCTVGSDFHSNKKQDIGIECEEYIYNDLIEKIKIKNNLVKK